MNEGEPEKNAAHWKYNADTSNVPQPTPPEGTLAPKESTIQWTASEFIAHHKGFGWYVVLVVITAVVAILAYMISHDRTTAGMVVVCGLAFGVIGSHKPRVLAYRLDESGITIGNKFYPYANYKAFAIIDEGRFANISFLPMKRFMPGLSIYFAPEDEERIINVLSANLPLQPGDLGIFDSIMHRIRF